MVNYISPGVYVKEIDISFCPNYLEFHELCVEIAKEISSKITANHEYSVRNSTLLFWNSNAAFNIDLYDEYTILHSPTSVSERLEYTDETFIDKIAHKINEIFLH